VGGAERLSEDVGAVTRPDGDVPLPVAAPWRPRQFVETVPVRCRATGVDERLVVFEVRFLTV